MARPIYDLKIKRKDGKSFTFTNYKGESQTSTTAKLGAIWPDRRDESKPGDLSFEPGVLQVIAADPKAFWVNIYSNDRDRTQTQSEPGDDKDLF